MHLEPRCVFPALLGDYLSLLEAPDHHAIQVPQVHRMYAGCELRYIILPVFRV